MHLPIRLAVAAVFGFAATIAIAQDNAVLILDARHKTKVCMVADVTREIDAPSNPVVCTDEGNHLLPYFLVQGQRNQLRVVHRKFLTQYSFFVDKVTPVANFAVEDLNEAANLTAPLSSSGTSGVSKGAVPKGLATSGTLALRNAQDLIAQLLNPATASNPANEVASDWVVVKREAENLLSDANAFQAVWKNIHRRPDDPEHPCQSAFGSPTLISADECLKVLNEAERSDTFTNAEKYNDEDGFRRLIVKDNDAIAMVTLLGSTLTQQTPLLTSQLSAFDGDLASLRADMNTVAGNVQAIQDAVDLLASITPAIEKTQIKAKLMQTLNAGSKPVLDDAELNVLTNDYYAFTESAAGQRTLTTARSAIELLLSQAIKEMYDAFGFADSVCRYQALGTKLECLADKIDALYSPMLQAAHTNLGQDLPTQVTEVNIQQSRLLARTNEIYDRSEVKVPLDKAIDLGGNNGNLRVYFTIYETETFPRFSIPSSATASVLTATPATIVTAPAASTATTTTATATTTTTTSAASPSGNPVNSGVIEVHDRYRATMVAAFAFSAGVKETSIQTNPVTTGIATGSTTANPIPCNTTTPCTQVTVSSGPAHSSVIFGISFHPWGYDTFPKAFSWNHPGQALKQGFGIFGGLSVQNLNDYYVGPDLQIAHGVQIMGGVNFFRQNTLAAGFVSGGIYPSTPTPNFTGSQRWTHGAYFGIGLNLSIFRKAFGSVTGLGTSAASRGS